MNPRGFLVGLAGLVALGGCGAKEPVKKPEPRVVQLRAGTEVPLVLLRQISAGTTREGTLVPFMVAEDVSVDGVVVIPKGSIAEGEVTWSRSEGSLGGLMNQPARLAVKLLHTRAADGGAVRLAADANDSEKAYAFNRENTGLDEARVSEDAIAQLKSSDVGQRVEAAIEGFFETGDATKLNMEAEANQWLRGLTRDNDMQSLEKSLDQGGSELERMVKHVRDGTITKLAGTEALLAVSAIQELARLGRSIGGHLADRLKGRTIKAYVGTKVEAFVAAETKVKVQSS